MDDFKTICICMKTYQSLHISLKNGRIFLISEKNPTFSRIFPRAKYVLNTFELRTLRARLYLSVVYILFVPVISTSIHRCVNNSSGIKVLMKVIETETLALYHNKFTNLDYSVFSTFFILSDLDPYLLSYIYLFTNPFTRAGYDTRLIF